MTWVHRTIRLIFFPEMWGTTNEDAEPEMLNDLSLNSNSEEIEEEEPEEEQGMLII